MPGYVPAQLRGLLLVGTLAGAVVVPCAVFALPGGTQQDTLIAARATAPAVVTHEVDDRPGVRITVAAPAPTARLAVRAPVRASRARRPAPAPRREASAVVVATMSGSLAARVLA